MLLTLVITLLLIGAAVIGTLYSNFLTFYSNFAETENYNKAYYASIAALERAELVVRQREPGYVGSGGRISYINDAGDTIWQTTGHYTTGSDGLITGFSYLSSGNVQGTNILRNINSRTTRIPTTGGGNIDWLLATGNNALDYNKMDYENAEIFLLYYDKSDNNPYTGASCSKGFCTKSTIDSISGKIKLPQKLYDLESMFGPLDTGNAIIGTVPNDAVVDWQLRGVQSNTPFAVYATQQTENGLAGNRDTAIREDDINKKISGNYTGVSVSIGNNKSPVVGKTGNILTVISQNEAALSGRNFKNFFNDNNTSQLQLRLALLNILKTKNNTIYPYLEYYLDFGSNEISDKYFTMNAEGKYGDYQVNLIIQKPTAKESILGSFTTIFE